MAAVASTAFAEVHCVPVTLVLQLGGPSCGYFLTSGLLQYALCGAALYDQLQLVQSPPV